MGTPPSAANDEFVEFLRVMLHRYGGDKERRQLLPLGARLPVPDVAGTQLTANVAVT